jgi:hypothetical protein
MPRGHFIAGFKNLLIEYHAHMAGCKLLGPDLQGNRM